MQIVICTNGSVYAICAQYMHFLSNVNFCNNTFQIDFIMSYFDFIIKIEIHYRKWLHVHNITSKKHHIYKVLFFKINYIHTEHNPTQNKIHLQIAILSFLGIVSIFKFVHWPQQPWNNFFGPHAHRWIIPIYEPAVTPL